MLLDVLGLVGHHADEGVELDDGNTQVDQVNGISQQDPQGRDEICGGNAAVRNTLQVSELEDSGSLRTIMRLLLIFYILSYIISDVYHL